MVKTRIGKHPKIVRNAVKEALKIFGRTLTLRRITRTKDIFGQLSSISTSDTTFTGDLRFGVNLDQRLIESGYVEVGEAVLYVREGELSILPAIQDQIIDGNAKWEIVDEIEYPELEGAHVFKSFRCRRKIESND
jgi:hypothetical protein